MKFKISLGGLTKKFSKNTSSSIIAPLPKSNSLMMGEFEYLKYLNGFSKFAVVTLSSYFVAAAVSTLINPLIPEVQKKQFSSYSRDPEKRPIVKYDQIYSRNLFNKDGLIPRSKIIDPEKPSTLPAVKTKLPLNLLGMIIVLDKLKSVASVEDRGSNKVIAVRVNEKINKQAIVRSIKSNKLIFYNTRTKRNEYIDIPDKISQLKTTGTIKKGKNKGIVAIDDTHLQIDRDVVNKALDNMGELLTQARCVPNMVNGSPAGFKCFQIVPGSIYEQLGMENGDVICGINGEPINNPGAYFQMDFWGYYHVVCFRHVPWLKTL